MIIRIKTKKIICILVTIFNIPLNKIFIFVAHVCFSANVIISLSVRQAKPSEVWSTSVQHSPRPRPGPLCGVGTAGSFPKTGSPVAYIIAIVSGHYGLTLGWLQIERCSAGSSVHHELGTHNTRECLGKLARGKERGRERVKRMLGWQTGTEPTPTAYQFQVTS